jgi:hypothetical protein
VGLACESASVRQVARQFGLIASTVRAIDLRYLQRWGAVRRKDPWVQMGEAEICFGKQALPLSPLESFYVYYIFNITRRGARD